MRRSTFFPHHLHQINHHSKKQLDNVGCSGDITKNIDLKNNCNVDKSKTTTFQELSVAKQSLTNFEEGKENFVGINESFPMKTYLDMGDKYLLLAEFSDRTVNYGRSFFPSIYDSSAKRAGHKSMEKNEEP